MASLRQIEANRRNALRSTGPRTDDGKATVARNAVKHGIFTCDLLVEGEDPQHLADHCDKLLADIAPQNYAEQLLAERIISATWRLRRLAAAEQHHHQSLADEERETLCEEDKPLYPGEEQDKAHADAARYASREQYRRKELIEQRRREWAMQQTCPAGLTLAIDLEDDNGAIDRFDRYEKRLEGTLHRAWRELRLLRKDNSPSPRREEEMNSAIVQNKANSDATQDTNTTCVPDQPAEPQKQSPAIAMAGLLIPQSNPESSTPAPSAPPLSSSNDPPSHSDQDSEVTRTPMG
jgi:hypothetical protein